MNNNKKKYKLIDEDGVIVQEFNADESAEEFSILITKEDMDRAERQKAGLRKKKTKDESLEKFNEINRDRGGFYMVAYVKNTLLFGEVEGIEDIDIPKLMYLATFLDYADRNEYKLVKKVREGNKQVPELLDRDELVELIKMSKDKGRRWLKNMSEIGMLNIIDKKYIELNSKYFLKGEIKDNDSFEKAKKQGNFTRVFIKTVQDLYEQNTIRKHRQLSYMFRLIPLAHIDSNIVCKDIASDKDCVMNYTFKEVVDMLMGEKTDSKNRARLEKDLHSFKISFNDEEIRPIRVVTLDEKDKDNLWYKKTYVVVNPLISFKGNHEDMVNIIMYFFSKQLG